MIVSRILLRNTIKYRDKVAVLDRGVEYTYAELQERARRLAYSLKSLNIGKGDRLALLIKNSVEFVDVLFAAVELEAIVVPLNFRLVEREISYMLKDSGAKAIICDPEYLGSVLNIKRSLPGLEDVIVTQGTTEGALAYEDLIKGSNIYTSITEAEPDDPLYIMYTSGTTGLPKGAVLTHRNVISTATSYAAGSKIDSAYTILLVAPVFHAGANITMMAAFLLGGRAIFHRDFIPQEIARSLSTEGVSATFMSPTMIQAVLMVPGIENMKFDNFRQLVYGGAPISESLQQKAKDVFHCELQQGFGLTESFGVIGLLLPEEHKPDRHGAAFREWVHNSVKVIDENEQEVPFGEVGEIVAKGPNIMKGYWNMPEETAETLKGGWLHTGDLGRMDEDGYVYIVDRKKDMIITGGENVYPVEVELVMMSHPEVAQAAVIGIQDAFWGESVKAYAILRPGASIGEKELVEYCKERLAAYKCPRSVEFRDTLPTTATGKVRKNVLREEAGKGS